MSVDNPYYFYNENKSPKTPDSSSKGFSFFRRRNSKGGGSTSSNNSQKISTSNQLKNSSRTFNSATLSQDAAILGSPRGSLGSLGSFNGATSPCFQSFELQQHQQNGMYKRSSGTFRNRLGSYNESLSYSENDDVFLQPNNRNITTRTLPTTTISNPNRRHSLGHLTSRERTRCNSFTDEVPKMIAPKPPAILSPMKYRVHRRKELYGNSNMDDILIITTKHSERAILWANFLKNRFDKITKQRGRKPFNFLHIKIDEGTLPNELTHKCLQTALQIIILCPAFISLSHSYLMSQLSLIINPDKVLGILLEIPEDKILEIHKTALPSFRKWKKCYVRDNDHSLIGNILGIATDILGRALCQRPPCQENNNNNTATVTTVSSPIVTGAITSINYKNSNTDEFTVLPRKVKIGQNKILILLNEPLIKDDWIKIIIEKSGELIMINNYRKRNPYTIQFNIPESCMEISTMIEIHVEKNEKHIGSRPVKCESRLRELEQLLRTQDSPIEFMCHSLGIGTIERDSLDLHLLQCFQKNMPSNFHLLTGSYDCKQNQNFITSASKESKPEEFPTLLHFAAKWGFERLCLQLLECPGGDAACEMKNCIGKTPAEIAEHEGYHNIAKNLKSFSQIHEFATMYHYFKGISDSTGNNKKVIIEPQIMTQIDLPLMKPKSDNGNDVLINNTMKSLKGEDVVDKSTTDDIQTEYMEMNSGSDDGDGRSSSSSRLLRPTTLAVTNLNYINVETQNDDCNLESFNKEFEKKFHEIKIIEDSEITSNELRINEPPYYQSTDNNNKIDDEFSKECSNVLENCNNVRAEATAEAITIESNHQLDYILQPSNIPINENVQINLNDYMIQPSNRPVIVETNQEIGNYMNESIITQQQQKHNKMMMMMMMTIQKDDDSHLMMNFEKKKSNNKNGTLKRTGSDTSSSTTRGNADDELAEIMYDFKNNVLTIREVEQLVEKWKNRNDVKQSFKEKQEQIEKLREEYERVQEQMKEKMKRPTPFERVKKLFSRNKQNTQQQQQQQQQKEQHQQQQQQHTYEDTDDTKSSITSFQSSQRPMSTLSLQSVSSSSSSSGRMSTVSACSGASLGDSGTHSDHEDRRQIFNSNCRIGLPGSLMVDNYMIPPTPRPILTPTSTPTPVEEKDRLIFTTAMMTSNRDLNSLNSPTSEHYIIFPSNVPVFNNNDTIGTNEPNNICHQSNNNNTNNSNNNGNSNSCCNGNNNNNIDSLPFCGLNTIIETKETTNDTCISKNNNNNNINNNNKNNGIVIKPIKVQNHDINNYTNSNVKLAYNNNNNNNNNENFSTFKPLKLKNSTDPKTQSKISSAIIPTTSSSSSSSSSSSPPPSSPHMMIDVKKEMSEVYQNINSLNDNTTKLSNNITKLIQKQNDNNENDYISPFRQNYLKENANPLTNELNTEKSNNTDNKNLTNNDDCVKDKMNRNYMNV